MYKKRDYFYKISVKMKYGVVQYEKTVMQKGNKMS